MDYDDDDDGSGKCAADDAVTEKGPPSAPEGGGEEPSRATAEPPGPPGMSENARQLISVLLEQMKVLTGAEKYELGLRVFQLSQGVDPLRQPLNPLGSRTEINRTISWIRTHLEEDQETSLPKQQVYEEYSSYCVDNQMKSLSQADFGKVMKQVYPRVRARRLGTRGNSRYCYSGLRRCIKLEPPELPDLADKPLSTEAPSSQSSLAAAAWLIVKEWSEVHFGVQFPSLQNLARFLVVNHSVGRGTEAAIQLTSATESQLKGEFLSSGKDGTRHREMQLQLQKKIQQKNEVKERKRKNQSPKCGEHRGGGGATKRTRGVRGGGGGAAAASEASPVCGGGAASESGGSSSPISIAVLAAATSTNHHTSTTTIHNNSNKQAICDNGKPPATAPEPNAATTTATSSASSSASVSPSVQQLQQQHHHFGLPDFNSFQKPPAQGSGAAVVAVAVAATSQQSRKHSTKYKAIQPKPPLLPVVAQQQQQQTCDNASYNNPIRSQEGGVHNVVDSRFSGEDADEVEDEEEEKEEKVVVVVRAAKREEVEAEDGEVECGQSVAASAMFPLPRERLESISNVDKDAMDEYLGTNNSQHEEELSKYFGNGLAGEGGGAAMTGGQVDPDTTSGGGGGNSVATNTKLSQLRQLLQQNGITGGGGKLQLEHHQESDGVAASTHSHFAPAVSNPTAVLLDHHPHHHHSGVRSVVVPYAMSTLLGQQHSQQQHQQQQQQHQQQQQQQLLSYGLQLQHHQLQHSHARRRVSFDTSTTSAATTTAVVSSLATVAPNVVLQRRGDEEPAPSSAQVPASPNTRRKNFSFTPISPGPQSPTVASKCSSANVSPFVSPRNTPVPRTKHSAHQSAGIMKVAVRETIQVALNGGGSGGGGGRSKQQQQLQQQQALIPTKAPRIKKEQPDLYLDIPDSAHNSAPFGGGGGGGKNYMSAPASPMLGSHPSINISPIIGNIAINNNNNHTDNKSVLQKLLNARGKVPYTPDYVSGTGNDSAVVAAATAAAHFRTDPQGCVIGGGASFADLLLTSQNPHHQQQYRSRSVPLHRMGGGVENDTDFVSAAASLDETNDEEYVLGGVAAPDFGDFSDAMPGEEEEEGESAVAVGRIIDALDERVGGGGCVGGGDGCGVGAGVPEDMFDVAATAEAAAAAATTLPAFSMIVPSGGGLGAGGGGGVDDVTVTAFDAARFEVHSPILSRRSLGRSQSIDVHQQRRGVGGGGGGIPPSRSVPSTPLPFLVGGQQLLQQQQQQRPPSMSTSGVSSSSSLSRSYPSTPLMVVGGESPFNYGDCLLNGQPIISSRPSTGQAEPMGGDSGIIVGNGIGDRRRPGSVAGGGSSSHTTPTADDVTNTFSYIIQEMNEMGGDEMGRGVADDVINDVMGGATLPSVGVDYNSLVDSGDGLMDEGILDGYGGDLD